MALHVAPASAADDRPALWGFTQIQAGGVVVVRPKFEGSRDYEVTGAPILAPAGHLDPDQAIVKFKGLDDLRFALLRTDGFEAGPLVGYRFGREDDDAARLRGLGDVDGGLVVGGYAGYRVGALFPFVSYHHQVTGDEAGGVARFGLEGRAQIYPGIWLSAMTGVSWADDDYMASFFGVTAAQSAGSGLAAYRADAGIKDAFIDLTTTIPLAERWSLRLGSRYSHLLGDAADSPIVETDSQWQGSLGITYRFDLPAVR